MFTLVLPDGSVETRLATRWAKSATPWVPLGPRDSWEGPSWHLSGHPSSKRQQGPLSGKQQLESSDMLAPPFPMCFSPGRCFPEPLGLNLFSELSPILSFKGISRVFLLSIPFELTVPNHLYLRISLSLVKHQAFWSSALSSLLFSPRGRNLVPLDFLLFSFIYHNIATFKHKWQWLLPNHLIFFRKEDVMKIQYQVFC